MGCRSLAYLRRLVGAGRMGTRRVGYRFAGSKRHYALPSGPGFAQRTVAGRRELRLSTLWGQTTWSIRSSLYFGARRLCITCSNCVISRLCRLFRDYAAGNTVSCVSGRVSLHIVRLSMNHQGRTAIAEQGMTVVAEGYVFVHNPEFSFAFGVYREVVHVAGMVA